MASVIYRKNLTEQQQKSSNVFDGWSARPLPLNEDEDMKGERADFTLFDAKGAAVGVKRMEFDRYRDGCVVYTKDPIPAGKAWRLTAITKTQKWQRGLTIGLTELPSKHPKSLPVTELNKGNYYFEIKNIHKDARQKASFRRRSSGIIVHNWEVVMLESVSLLFASGKLCLFCDNKFSRVICDTLPLDKDLWGSVDVYGDCVEIQSELLTENDENVHSSMDIPGIFKIKKEVPQKDEVVEVSPEDYGINVKIPPGAMPAVSDEKPVILFGHLCPLSKSLEFPIGPYSVGPYSVSPYSVSPIYHLSSNTNLREEVEVSIQHVQNVETKEQAEQMMFMVAEPPTHGAKLVKFTPVEGKFEVNEDHGTLKTDKLGYFSIASQSLEKPKKRYNAHCCYTTNTQLIHFAVAVSLDHKLYTGHLYKQLEKEWKTVPVTRVITNVSFESSKANVRYPAVHDGWTIDSDMPEFEFLEEDVDHEHPNDLGPEVYPPRNIMAARPTESAESSKLSLEITGLSRPVMFNVPMDITVVPHALTKQSSLDLNLKNLLSLGDIKIVEESARHYEDIGIFLLNDHSVRNITLAKGSEPKAIIKEIYREWLEKDTDYSWSKLCRCLRRCSLAELASRIEDYIGIPSPLPQSPIALAFMSAKESSAVHHWRTGSEDSNTPLALTLPTNTSEQQNTQNISSPSSGYTSQERTPLLGDVSNKRDANRCASDERISVISSMDNSFETAQPQVQLSISDVSIVSPKGSFTMPGIVHLSKSTVNLGGNSTARPTQIQRSKSTPIFPCSQKKHTIEAPVTPVNKSNICCPDYITQITSLTCTSNGLRFVDEANDFILEIPERAIPQSDTLTIDVGVALFGPFQFPKGLRPVSPVFWVCVRNQPNFIFSKPVSLTIPHFLNLESDREIKYFGLTFLKAGHKQNPSQYHEFHATDGEPHFDLSMNTGLFRTKHFCSLCIACKDTPTCLSMAKFCLTIFIPHRAIIGRKQLGFFFITLYNLKTCLAKVDEVIQRKKLEHYEKMQVEFDFKSWFYKDAALEINITQPAKGKIGLMGKKKIFRSEVDFFLKRRTAAGDMKGLEEKDFYPPRFQIFLVSTADDVSLSEGKIKFKGARSELEYDVFLEQPEPDVSLLSLTSSSTQDNEIVSSVAATKQLDISRDVPCVRTHLKDLEERELRDLFQELGLDYSTVNNPTGSRQDIAEKLIRAWILEKDDVLQQQEYTGATWDDLRKALKKLKHHGIARMIPV